MPQTPANYTPEIGMRVRRLGGAEAGNILVIEAVRERSQGVYSITGHYEGEDLVLTRDAERFEPVAAEPIISASEAVAAPTTTTPTFAIGEEVIISARVLTPEHTRKHQAACEVASNYVGQECIVSGIRTIDCWIHIAWNDGGNSWFLPPQYLDKINTSPIRFNTAWRRLVSQGASKPVLMDFLYPKLSAPIEMLSREKGDWNSLLISRAVLRLRRQHPGSYEEAIAKRAGWESVWNVAWTALINQ